MTDRKGFLHSHRELKIQEGGLSSVNLGWKRISQSELNKAKNEDRGGTLGTTKFSGVRLASVLRIGNICGGRCLTPYLWGLCSERSQSTQRDGMGRTMPDSHCQSVAMTGGPGSQWKMRIRN